MSFKNSWGKNQHNNNPLFYFSYYNGILLVYRKKDTHEIKIRLGEYGMALCYFYL